MRFSKSLYWLGFSSLFLSIFVSSPALPLNHLRSLAESELRTPSSQESTSAPGLSVATVEILSPPPPARQESIWRVSLRSQSFQPLGQFVLPGLSPLDLSQIPKSELIEVELQTELRPRLASFVQMAGGRRSLTLRGPQGAEIERTHLSSFVLIGGLNFELYRWGQRPLILGLRSGVGQLSHIVSSSWVEANQSANQWIWSLGPTLAWEFYPGIRSSLTTQRQGELSSSSQVSIESVSWSLGLQVDLDALR